MGVIDARSFIGALLRNMNIVPLTEKEAEQYEKDWADNLEQEDVIAKDISNSAELLDSIRSDNYKQAMAAMLKVCGKASAIGLHIMELKNDNKPGLVMVFVTELVERALAENAMLEKEGYSFEFASPEGRQKLGTLLLEQIANPDIKGIKADPQQISAAKLAALKLINDYEREHSEQSRFDSENPQNYPAVCRLIFNNADKISEACSGGNHAAAIDITIELLKTYSEAKTKAIREKREAPFNIRATEEALQAA